MKHVMTGEDYVAFLVERRDAGLRYLSLDNVLEIVWVEEADDALHFTRRSDAERMVDNAPDEWDIHICDHQWIDGAPRDRIVPYSGDGGSAERCTNNRPEWAQGDAWDGWQWDPHHHEMRRQTNCGSVQIESDDSNQLDHLWVVGDSCTNYIDVARMSTAIAIANLIAEDQGGWA